MNNFLKDIKDNKPIIIIGYSDYFPLLSKYLDNKANIKLMTTSKAVSYLSFEINNDMIAALIAKDIEYTKTKKILSILQVLTPDKLAIANNLLKNSYDTIKPYIVNNGFDRSYIFKNKSLYLLNASGDVQTVNLFKSKGFNLQHLSLEETGIDKKKFSYPSIVYTFDNKIEQYLYVFADIRTKLLKDPNVANNIRIVVKDEYDLFYLSLCAKAFNVDIYANLQTLLYNQPSVIEALKDFYNKYKAIDIKYIKGNDAYSNALKDIITKYKLDKLSFEKGFLNLQEIVLSTFVRENNLDDKGIIVTNEFVFGDFDHYILDFQDDIFYKSFKDNDVITDIEKVKLGLNPSYINTIIDKQKKYSYVQYNNITLLSRVKQHLDEHIYDSPLTEPLGLENELFNFNRESYIELLTKKSFTSDAAVMLAAVLADKRFNTKDFKQIDSYDNQPDEISVKLPKKYSISQVQKYNKCPFKYLMERYGQLNTLDDTFFMELGTLVHAILQHVQDDVFNFEELFNENAKTFRDNLAKNNNGVYEPKYEAYLAICKHWFEKIANQYRVSLQCLNNPVKILDEVEFNFKIDEISQDFTGKIDCLMLSSMPSNKYYSIIDYKTGSDKFDPAAAIAGTNVQLPVYAWALNQSDKKSLIADRILGGFGLKHVLGSNPKKYAAKKSTTIRKTPSKYDQAYYLNDSTLNKYLETAMKAIEDEDFKLSISNYVSKDDGSTSFKGYDQTASISKNELEHNANKYKYTLEWLCQCAKNAVIATIKKMQKQSFSVLPTATDGNLLKQPFALKKDMTNCKYCKLADVCYRKPSDFNDLSNSLLLKFAELKEVDE